MPEDANLLACIKARTGYSMWIYRRSSGEIFAAMPSRSFYLKGLYQSMSNVEDVQDVKVLIEGKETETLGVIFTSSSL